MESKYRAENSNNFAEVHAWYSAFVAVSREAHRRGLAIIPGERRQAARVAVAYLLGNASMRKMDDRWVNGNIGVLVMQDDWLRPHPEQRAIPRAHPERFEPSDGMIRAAKYAIDSVEIQERSAFTEVIIRIMDASTRNKANRYPGV